MDYEFVPSELRAIPQWIVWKIVHKGDGKSTKIPCNAASGLPADVTDRSNYLDFDAARDASWAFSGIGFVFMDGDGFCGVDLDHCLDENGEIAPWAERYLDGLQSYSEISPSGRGIKVFLRGRLPDGAKSHKKSGLGLDGTGEVEFYDGRRYFTVTGRHVEGTPLCVEDRGEELAGFYHECFPAEKPKGNGPAPAPNGKSLGDEDILRSLRFSKSCARFRDLFDRGDLTRYHGDHSRADLALCSDLAFWCKGNPETIDRLFRKSKLNREKWEQREDYRKLTIDRAIAGMKGYYSSNGRVDDHGTPSPPPSVEDDDLVIRAEDIDPESVDWLWEDRIPQRFLTVFYGRTAIGKSFVALDIAARVTTGSEWPFSDGLCAEPGNVLIISEDPIKQMLIPRLMALGADRNRVRFMSWKAMIQWKIDDTVLLERACVAAGGPVLIVVDPPTNFLGDRDEHKNSEVRGALMHLVTWLDSYPTAMACILCTHTRKPTGNSVDSIFNMIGSIAWGTTARIAHALETDPEDKTRCIFACSKTNIGEKTKALAYRMKRDVLEVPGKRPIKVATVEWMAEVDLDADDLTPVRKKKPRGVVAVEWLIERFREKPMWESKELFDHAANAGLSRMAMFSPESQALPIVKRQHTRADGSNYWTWTAKEGWPPEPPRACAPAREEDFDTVDTLILCPAKSLSTNPYARVSMDGAIDTVILCPGTTNTDQSITVSEPEPIDTLAYGLVDKDLAGQSIRVSTVSKGGTEEAVVIAMEILMDNLRHGPRRAIDVEEYASTKHGVDEASMLDAVDRFDVVKTVIDGEIYWSLKGGSDS